MLNIEDELIIQNLSKSLFNGSLVFELEHEEISRFTWDLQKVFLDITVNSPRFKKYPVNVNFCKLFFKKLINYLEPEQEVHDDMYSFLCSEMNKNNGDDFYYQHYMINNKIEDSTIIKETKNMVVNGTTGLKTWEAAFILSDWALKNKNIFSKKKILELGSGIGFTGITIAKHCDIINMSMTDCHPDVLRTLKDNIEINFPNYHKEIQYNHDVYIIKNNKSLEVFQLDWNCKQDLTLDIMPDVIIGADIIYDPSILTPLCQILKILLQRNAQTEIYICSIIRNIDTHNQFLEKLGSSKLAFENILQSEETSTWGRNMNKCLLKITQKSKEN